MHDLTKSLIDKKTKTFINGFFEKVNELKRKSNRLWVVKGKKFYNNLMKNNCC